MNLLISMSGGETSLYMTLWLLNNRASDFDDVKVVFANTGQENEETLNFINRCSDHYGFDVVWLEAVVNEVRMSGTKHAVVDYESANRDGRVFEEVIKKYGIPNQAYPHCTRELKTAPIHSYATEIWGGRPYQNYYTAIGIRVDEIDRMAYDAKERNIIYPLVKDKPMTKQLINQWWSEQPFRLNLKGYQGNCKWCWKKSLRKHLTNLAENPEWYEFPDRMEKKHGLSGHNVDGTERVFFRNNMTVEDLRELAKQPFTKANDDAQTYPEPDLFGYDLDVAGGCSESCEVE